MALFAEGKLFKVAGTGSGGGDLHNKGWFATQAALEEAHPTAEAGDWAIVGATDTVWIWDTDNSEWVDSDQKGQVTSVNGQTGDVVLDLLPDQTGQGGKFLRAGWNGNASWQPALINYASSDLSLSVSHVGTVISGLHAVQVGNGYAGDYSVSVGASAGASGINRATCVGAYAHAGAGGIALGFNANNMTEEGTFVVGLYSDSSAKQYKLLDANGTIPTARLTKVNTTATLAVADWSSNTQTVSISGITADGVVFVSPVPASQVDYTSAGIICSAQAAGALTFTCDTVPSNNISVTVVML